MRFPQGCGVGSMAATQQQTACQLQFRLRQCSEGGTRDRACRSAMQAVVGQLPVFSGLSCKALPVQRVSINSQAARPGLHQPLTIQAVHLNRKEANQKRHRRIRNKVNGSGERPRLAVYRSNNHIYAQVIDDTAGNTLVAASTLTPDVRSQLNGTGTGGNQDAAQLVGRKIAELCLSKSIEKVAFDRGGHVYHGRIKALADAAREGGLQF